MNVKELYKYLSEQIPTSLSCSWDNDGLMCAPDSSANVSRVLITLDITAEVTDKAIREGYDLVISHHPLIFKGVKSLTDDAYVSAKLIDLVRAGVSAMSFHTRLDAVEGGVNDALAALLGLENTSTVSAANGRAMLIKGRVNSREEAVKNIENISMDMVKELAGRIFVKGGESISVVG